MRSGPAGAKIVSRRRPSRRSRTVSAGIATVAVSLLAAGCHVLPGTGSSTAALTKTSITVAAQPGVDNAPLYLALHNGLFANAGLTVNIQTYSSASQEIGALTNGSANVAIGDYADFFFAQDAAHHPGFSIVADAYDAAPSVMQVLALPGTITTPQQLVGKTIGTPQPQGIPYDPNLPYSEETLATQSVLTDDGVDPKSVHWRAMPTSQLVGALQSHQVSAILATEPIIYQAETQLGATAVIDSCSGRTASLPLAGYFTLGSFAQKYRSTVLAFRSALLKAQAQAAQAAQVQAVLASDEHMGSQTAALVTLGVYPTALKASSLQRVAALMSAFNRLNTPIDVTPLIFH
jgi:NitT/TauT family transport system substrate-binding protein